MRRSLSGAAIAIIAVVAIILVWTSTFVVDSADSTTSMALKKRSVSPTLTTPNLGTPSA